MIVLAPQFGFCLLRCTAGQSLVGLACTNSHPPLVGSRQSYYVAAELVMLYT